MLEEKSHEGVCMKAVVIYEPGSASMEQIMAIYPRHKVLVDAFAARGEALAIGTLPGAARAAWASSKAVRRPRRS
jgi:hypothetical protein